MIIYGSTISPFVRKTAAYCAEKGLPFEIKAAGMGRGGPDFEDASPFRKMPALRDDDGFGLCDSTAIIAYLEAKHPQPELIPAEARDRGRAIWLEEFGDTMLCAVAGRIFFNRLVAPKFMKRAGDEAVAAAAEADELPPLFDYLEGQVPASGFLVGDRLTIADLAVASPFVNLQHLGIAIGPARWPNAAAYVDAILARPSFATMIDAERRFLATLG